MQLRESRKEESVSSRDRVLELGRRGLDGIYRNRHLALLGLFAFYALVAVAKGPVVLSDEGGYVQYATALFRGDYFAATEPGQFMHWGPGLPLLLGPFVELGVPLELSRLVLSSVVLTVSVGLFGQALVPDLGQRLATLCAALLALYWPAWVTLGAVCSEPATQLMLVAALGAWLASRRSQSLIWAAIAGLALGFATLIRVEFGYIILAGLLISSGLQVARRDPASKRSLVATVVALAVCSPWLVYTYSESGKVLYWGTSGGENLYWTAASSSPFEGDWKQPEAALRDHDYRPFWPKFKEWLRLDPVSRDSAFQSAARLAIEQDPGRFVLNSAKAVARTIWNVPYSFEPLTPRKLVAKLFYGVPNTLLVLLVAWAAALLTHRRKWRFVAVAPVFVAATNLGLHLPLAALPRHLIPIAPVWIWFSVTGWLVSREGQVGTVDAP